ncbi:unnamed protein product, partial [Prorocentrum cordatum]
LSTLLGSGPVGEPGRFATARVAPPRPRGPDRPGTSGGASARRPPGAKGAGGRRGGGARQVRKKRLRPRRAGGAQHPVFPWAGGREGGGGQKGRVIGEGEEEEGRTAGAWRPRSRGRPAPGRHGPRGAAAGLQPPALRRGCLP